MNLNEFVINRGRCRGKKIVKGKGLNVFGSNNICPPPTATSVKKDTTPSSGLNWGNTHISVPITPSTIQKSTTTTKTSSDEESRIVVALTEGRGEARCEVGIAVINVSKPLLILCQISDTQSYINTLTKINIFDPHEILFPMTFVKNFSGNRLIDKVKQKFPNIKCTGVARSTFNKINGKEILSDMCIPSLNAILLVLQYKYYALAAASALITYVQDNLFIYYASGSIKIQYQESEGYAIIDVSTADRLELVCSTKPALGNKYSSLFGVLNHCQTKIGARMLRSCILQPPCDVQYIEERLKCVTELAAHPETLLSVQALLQKLSNIDLLLTIGTIIPTDPQKCSNRQLNYILLLNSLLDLIAPLKEVLSKLSSPFFAKLKSTLESEEFNTIKNVVRNTIQENAHPAKGEAGVLQRCFAIKPGINGLLDLVRKTYSERVDDMREYVKRLAEKYDLALTLANNQTKGHHIVLNLNQKQKRYMKKSDLPDEFIQVYRLLGSFTMKTAELINLSTRLDDIMRDILTISNVMVHSIIVEIKKYITLFYKLCDEIAHMDVLQSLAEASLRNNYIRPKFGDFTEVTFARHPMLDFLLSTRPVSNSISCSSDFNIHVITGPNGSGKSIFIRQVLLLQVMAQMGCYVPAQTATFRPADRMYARICLEDNMEYGASSFMLEMKEIKYIMTTMTDNSLIIIDEPCRSTCLEEGTALAIAVVEKLAQSSAFIYITTHFTLLTKLYEMYLNVKVWQLETIPSGDDPRTFKLDFKYSLIPGATSVKHYGVYIVRNIWPATIIKYVDKLLEKITKEPANPIFATIDKKTRVRYAIESQLRKLKSQNKLTIAEINKLQNQYQDDLQELRFSVDVMSLLKEKQFAENMPQIRHSIFDVSQNLEESRLDEDLQSTEKRLKQIFTPNTSLFSETSTDLYIQKKEARMREIFTPEVSQQSYIADNNLLPSCAIEFSNFQVNFNNSQASDSYNYQNISKFINENPENIQKLIPEVNVSYEDVSSASQSSSHIAHNLYGLVGSDFIQPLENRSDFPDKQVGSQKSFQRQKLSKQNPRFTIENQKAASSIDLSKDMDDFRFSEPLCNDLARTSTPLTHQEYPSKSSSPLLHIYRGQSHNFLSPSSNTNNTLTQRVEKNTKVVLEQSKTPEDIDLVSLQEDLEVCSKVFEEDDDDFAEDTMRSTQTPLPREERTCNKAYYQHIIPRVTVIEGPNNTTLSIDENDLTEDLDEKQENCAAKGKINIISDIAITASGQIKTKTEEMVENNIPNDYTSDNKEEDEQENCEIKDKSIREDTTVTHIEKLEIKQENVHNTSSEKAEEIREMNLQQQLVESNNEIFKDSSIYHQHFTKYRNTPRSASDESNDPHTTNGHIIPLVEDENQFEMLANKSNAKECVPEHEKQGEEKLKPDENVDSSYNVDKTSTSISYASKVRNLEQVTSDSSPSEETKKTSNDKTTSSMSSVSRKRNLDQITSDSNPTEETNRESVGKAKDDDEATSSLKESDNSEPKGTKHARKKFSIPRRVQNESVEKISSQTDAEQSPQRKKFKKCADTRKRFIPPRKLTAKEIKEDFREQDRKILEASPSSSHFSKYLSQLINRPSVKQMQSATHVAFITKTNEGFEVIPAPPAKKIFKKSPIKRHFSTENFNVSIFSDKNANFFENFLNSTEKDYKTFNFNRQKTQGYQLGNWPKEQFAFEPTALSFGEYSKNSVTTRFMRTASDIFQSQTTENCGQQNPENTPIRQASEMNQNFAVGLTQQTAYTLTPDGFYKQNKDDVTRILNRYLQSDPPATFQGDGAYASRNANRPRNMFETENLSDSDLNL